MWQYAQHDRSPLSQLLKLAHGYSIVQWFSLIFGPGAFHMFYKYATDITYITENRRKKNQRSRTWVSPKRKKGEVLALFWHFCASVAIASVYPSEFPTQLPGTLSHPLAPATGPKSSFFSSCLSLTVAFPWLTLTPMCLLPWDLAFPRLVGNLVLKPFVWVSRQNRQRNLLTGAHPHTHPHNECPPSCHTVWRKRLIFFIIWSSDSEFSFT